eukprot:Rhum_TRINITY_DN14943_c23_g1::Rhum_TRINITY_DN14943_c23_g1_i1::g.127482::m.127482
MLRRVRPCWAAKKKKWKKKSRGDEESAQIDKIIAHVNNEEEAPVKGVSRNILRAKNDEASVFHRAVNIEEKLGLVMRTFHERNTLAGSHKINTLLRSFVKPKQGTGAKGLRQALESLGVSEADRDVLHDVGLEEVLEGDFDINAAEDLSVEVKKVLAVMAAFPDVFTFEEKDVAFDRYVVRLAERTGKTQEELLDPARTYWKLLSPIERLVVSDPDPPGVAAHDEAVNTLGGEHDGPRDSDEQRDGTDAEWDWLERGRATAA